MSVRRATALRLGAAAAFALPAAPARAAETVRLGLVHAAGDAPFYIAVRKNYFREAGLDVTFSPFSSAADMIAPLGAGQLDVGSGGPSAGLFNAAARGVAIKIVADQASDPPGYGFESLLVRSELVKSGRFKRLGDLRGLTIALSAPGSSSFPTLAVLLAKAGVPWDDVKRVSLPYPDHSIALKNGSVDAALTIEPQTAIAVRNGWAERVVGNDAYYPNQEVGVVLYSEAFITQRRAAAERFMLAYLRGARFYNDALRGGRLDGPTAEAVVPMLVADSPIKDPTLIREIVPTGCDPNGRVNVASLRSDLAWFQAQGLVPRGVDVAAIVDPSFAAAAVRTLGPYAPRR